GAEQDERGAEYEPARVVLADRPGQAPSRDETDPRAHELDGGHQGEREEGRPQERVAEGRARDGVCRDPAGVVVGRAGDETGPQGLEVAEDRVVGVAAWRPVMWTPATPETPGRPGSWRPGVCSV